jgi:hypothetical protein
MFAAAALGKDEVAALATQLKNRSLMGARLGQRVSEPHTVAEFDDLKSWLKKYDDYPEAAHLPSRRAQEREGRART